jgi:outer membrane protein assembly factor BamB
MNSVLIRAILALLLLITIAHAQTPVLEWTMTFGESPDSSFVCNDAVLDQDGGFILVGSVQNISQQRSGPAMMKFDSMGVLEWFQVYWDRFPGGTAKAIRQEPDGSYRIGGIVLNNPADSSSIFVLHVDARGDTLYSHSTRGGGDILFTTERPFAAVTPEGGLLVSGWLSGNARLVCLDSSGERAWTHSYGGSSNDCFYGRACVNGGYVVPG